MRTILAAVFLFTTTVLVQAQTIELTEENVQKSQGLGSVSKGAELCRFRLTDETQQAVNLVESSTGNTMREHFSSGKRGSQLAFDENAANFCEAICLAFGPHGSRGVNINC